MGGSLGGLTTAHALLRLGCDVHVHERSPTFLDSRGAGIVLHPLSERLLLEMGLPLATFATRVAVLRYVDSDGAVISEAPVNYRFTAWNTIYRALHERLPTHRHHLGEEVTEPPSADLVVFADGPRSRARSRLLPGVATQYAGYVAWRGVLPESALSARSRRALGDGIVYHLRPAGHVLSYPIPGEPGDRLLNFVWYRNVSPEGLRALMTDRDGTLRDLSVPSGLVRAEPVAELRAAAAGLPPALAELVGNAPDPFVQQIVDVVVPKMAFGSHCLLGDAAFVARPHAAAGTAKAASDAWALHDALATHRDDVGAALSAWELPQLQVGSRLVARVRAMGEAVQFGAGWRPGDPDLRFGLTEPGDSEEEWTFPKPA